METIKRLAYTGCDALTTVTLPASLNSIEGGIFQYCDNLTKVIVPKSLTMNLNDSLYGFNAKTAGPIGSGCDVEFGWDEEIPDGVFERWYSLEKVTIPATVTKIGNNAFNMSNDEDWNSNLKEITLSENLTSIGANAFRCCNNLEGIIFPDNLTSIGDYSFAGCSKLKEITFSNNLKSIGYLAFDNCVSVEELSFPDSLETIGRLAFL